MPPKSKSTGQKGTFSEARLAVAEGYLRPLTRNRPLLIGLLLTLAALGVALGDLWLRQGRLISNGPLSSSHASLEKDCSNCHDSESRRAEDERCLVCHEKFGDELGIYGFRPHYLYRSNDFRRLVDHEGEIPCYGCHVEHEGRDAVITRVADVQCISCHPDSSFEDRHPEFEHRREGLEDAAGLRFRHVHHVREVVKRLGTEDVEQSCLVCHNAGPDGRSFEPLSFDRHCDACHLPSTVSTPALPIRNESAGTEGVETLETILERGGAATRWAVFSNPREFRLRGSSVSKAPIYHQDPWILENLRRLRRVLYPDAGLADLLRASADVPAHESLVLYREALKTLEDQALGLRSRPEPEIQAQLQEIRKIMDELERRLDDPYAPLDETGFLLALGSVDPDLPPERVEEIETLIDELTAPCQQCHFVRRGTIGRVQKDQRQLRRAEYDHRAHITQRRCLECHTEIAIQEHLLSAEEIDVAVDSAVIQNLPGVDVCRECHNTREASDRCITCHLFHPDKSQRSNLLLYLSEPE